MDEHDGRPTHIDTVRDAPTVVARPMPFVSEAEVPPLPPRFEPLGLLGRGGMGIVMLARDRQLEREVAVKVLARHSDERTKLRLAREAQCLATLDHPGIVRVFDVAPDGSWIVMERVRGESLSKRLHRAGPMSAREVRRLGIALLDALAATHAAGIVHRDVKPSNVLYDEAGVVRLVDFGVAASGDHNLTATSAVVGTPCYMAPEQLRSASVDARADVYAAGATLFEAATGRRLHDPERVRDPRRAVIAATGDSALARAVARAVEERPEDRFPSAAAFGAALAAGRSRRWLIGAAAALGVVAIGLVAFALTRPAEPPVPHAAPPAGATIALAPFTIEAPASDLDYASQGLAHVLGRELGRAGVPVIGADRMTDLVGDPGAQAVTWRETAASHGAGIVIEGHVAGAGDRLEVVVDAVGPDGTVFAEVRRSATPERLPAVVGELVPELAGLLGRPVTGAPAPAHRFDVEHGLLVAIAEIDSGDPWSIADATSRLDLAVRADPDLAEGRYYLALAAWMLDGSGPDPATAIDAALADDLAPPERALLAAMRRMAARDYATAIADLRVLAVAQPHHRWIQLALVEALYHGGFPDDAVVRYRQAFPAARFGVGAAHVLLHAMSRGDDEAARWALERVVTGTGDPDPILRVRTFVARRDYDGARAAVADGLAADLGYLQPLRLDGAVVDALDGQLDAAIAEARDLREKSASEPPPELDELLWALAVATGDDAERRRWRDASLAHAALADGEQGAAMRWALRAVEPDSDLEAPPPPTARFAADPWYQAIALLLDGGPAPVTTHPWVAAIGRALVAEGEHRDADAAAAWRDALAATGEDLVIAQQFRLAAALRRAGDEAGVVAACDEVIRPRAFDPTWGSSVGPCLLWTGQAAAATGHPDQARTSFERLLAMRRRAGPDDALAAAARAELAGLSR